MGSIKKGIVWSAIEKFSVQGIQFILSIIIARLIEPSAYGAIVIAMVFINFANLFIESGFKDALVQKIDRNERDYHTIFIFNLIIAIILYFVIFVLSNWISAYYDNPELESILKVLSLSLIFSSFSITQIVKLTVALDFEKQTKARLSSSIISGFIGVLLAYTGFEVWALVVQYTLNALLTTIFLMILVKWTPRLIFDFKSFKLLFSFGYKLLLSNVLTLLYIQFTNLFIGKIYSPAQLAFYDRGFHLSQYPSVNVSSIICRVTYPALCSHQNDKDELKAQYLKYLHFACFCIFPLMCILAAVSKPVVLILLTEKWIECASFISVFCAVFFFYPIIESGMVLLNSVGLSNINLKGVIYKRIVSIILLILSIKISVMAVAISLVIGNSVECIINSLLIKKHIGFSIYGQFSHLIDVLVSSIIAGVISYAIVSLADNYMISLLLSLASGLLVYLLCCSIFRVSEISLLKNAIFKII